MTDLTDLVGALGPLTLDLHYSPVGPGGWVAHTKIFIDIILNQKIKYSLVISQSHKMKKCTNHPNPSPKINLSKF